MIVLRLVARNALKYARLELSDLPETGVILLTGPNESGKSTVGELLCLALFGRTYALPTDRIERAVRWNARQMDLELVVLAPDGERWRIHRHIDLDGERGASLTCAATEVEVHGWAAVSEAVVAMLGYEFDAFVESFYLARREISPPHPRSETLKAMAGVLPLHRVADELLTQVPAFEAESVATQEEAQRVQAQLDAVGRVDLLPPRPGAEPGELVEEVTARRTQLRDARIRIQERLPVLRSATDRLVDLLDGAPLARWEARTDALDDALDGVEEAMSWLGYSDVTAGTEKLSGFLDKVNDGVQAFQELLDKAAARARWIAGMLGEPGAEPVPGSLGEDEEELARRHGSAQGRTRLLSALAVGLAALTVVGFALGFLPMERLAPQAVLGGRAVGVVAVLALLGALWSRQALAQGLRAIADETEELDARRRELEADGKLLEGLAARPMPDAVRTLKGLSREALRAEREAFEAGPGGRITRDGLKAKLESAVALRMAEVEDHLAQLTLRIGADLEELDTIFGLRERLVALAERRAELAESIATFELGAELALGAARAMTHDFNAQVRQSMVRVLPSLTEGRYQYLQIDEGSLAVRVFSSEKQDFVMFEEISGGTQRQIELATRFALSEAMATATSGGPQFLFLDEPFAFFDATRTRASMAALPRLSATLPQVWIAAQEAPAGARAERHIALSLAGDTLVSGQ